MHGHAQRRFWKWSRSVLPVGNKPPLSEIDLKRSDGDVPDLPEGHGPSVTRPGSRWVAESLLTGDFQNNRRLSIYHPFFGDEKFQLRCKVQTNYQTPFCDVKTQITSRKTNFKHRMTHRTLHFAWNAFAPFRVIYLSSEEYVTVSNDNCVK